MVRRIQGQLDKLIDATSNLASIWQARFAHFPVEAFFYGGLMHYSRDLQVQNSTTFSLKLNPMALFTHLKFILL